VTPSEQGQLRAISLIPDCAPVVLQLWHFRPEAAGPFFIFHLSPYSVAIDCDYPGPGDAKAAFLSGSIERMENISVNRPQFPMPNSVFVTQTPKIA
jgi:hypothetical protein